MDLYILPCISTILLPQHPTILFDQHEQQQTNRHTFINTHGIGIKTIEIKASVELAQSTPKFLYIADANRGNPAPNEDLKRSFPARTDAAYAGYASGSQFSTELNKRNVPILKKEDPTTGMIQLISDRALHPNQKRQIGIKKPPTHAGGRRASGLILPFSSNFGSTYLYIQ